MLFDWAKKHDERDDYPMMMMMIMLSVIDDSLPNKTNNIVILITKLISLVLSLAARKKQHLSTLFDRFGHGNNAECLRLGVGV